jgi:AcrR family transcriptional regulator
MSGRAAPASRPGKHRAQILDAAERLLGRYGYRKMTVDDLAAEAGIGKGTVYLSFSSKEEVILATVDRIVDAALEEMQRIAASAATAPETLRAMLLARVLVRFDRVSSYRESLNELLSSIRRSLLERRATHFAREIDLVAAAIRSGQRSGELSERNARRTARAMILATNNFLPYALSPPELGDRRQLIGDATDVIDLLIASLTVPDSPAPP